MKTVTPELQKAFEAMIKGKSFRLSEIGKEEISRDGNRSDTWFSILAINSDGTINICGNNHSIWEGFSLSVLKLN